MALVGGLTCLLQDPFVVGLRYVRVEAAVKIQVVRLVEDLATCNVSMQVHLFFGSVPDDDPGFVVLETQLFPVHLLLLLDEEFYGVLPHLISQQHDVKHDLNLNPYHLCCEAF